MKVAAIFTGGTIGCAVSTEALALETEAPRRILTDWSSGPGAGSDVEFVVSEPFRILSEDATPEHWEHMARHVRKRVDSKVDAVVVFHGSDTLPWTAAALAFALRGLPVPLVLVASDLPLDDPAANGPANLAAALSFVREEMLPGVFVVWTHPGEATTVYLGTRLQPADPLDDRFDAPRGLVFGRMDGTRFVRSQSPANPTREAVVQRRDAMTWSASCKRLETNPQVFARRLLVLPPHPGLDTGRIPLDLGWQGILQLPYHSGTASSTAGEASVLDLVRRATERNIPFLLGPVSTRAVPYSSTQALLEAGAKLVPAMSTPAAQAKLMLLLGTQGHLAGLDQDFAFELVWRVPL